MAKRRSSALDFIQSFNDAYDTVNKVGKDYEMSKVANAKPEQFDGFTPEDGAKIQAAADSGQSHINYDDKTKAYMATPKLGENEMGPAQPVEIARQGTMTDFMGQRTPGVMSESQVASARQRAMAGVMSKYDPVQGARMMRDVVQGEREDKRWQREDKNATDEEAYKKGLQAEYAQTAHSKSIGEYATQVQAYDQYQAKLKGGAAPETLGAPPPQPQRPAYSAAQSLADNGRLLAYKASHGKADPTEILQYAQRLQQVTDEGYGKALKLAQSGASLDKVIAQFNETGNMKIDPASVVSDEMVKGADGMPGRVIKVRDPSGNVQTINAMSELEAIGQAENYFGRFDKNRNFDLAERKTAVAERQADIAEKRLAAMEARAAGGGGRGGGGQGGEATASFNPLEGFDYKNAQSAATSAVDAQIERDGKQVTSQARAQLISDQVFRLRDAYADQNASRQRAAVFRAEARTATTPKAIEALRQRAAASGYTPDEMAALDKRFAPPAAATAPASTTAPGKVGGAKSAAANPPTMQGQAKKQAELDEAYKTWQAAKRSWFQQDTPGSEEKRKAAEKRYEELLRNQYNN